MGLSSACTLSYDWSPASGFLFRLLFGCSVVYFWEGTLGYGTDYLHREGGEHFRNPQGRRRTSPIPMRFKGVHHKEVLLKDVFIPAEGTRGRIWIQRCKLIKHVPQLMLVAFGKGDNVTSCERHKRELYDSNMHVWSVWSESLKLDLDAKSLSGIYWILIIKLNVLFNATNRDPMLCKWCCLESCVQCQTRSTWMSNPIQVAVLDFFWGTLRQC